MSDISSIYKSAGASFESLYASKTFKSDNKKSDVKKSESGTLNGQEDVSTAYKKNYLSGKTIGKPKLSEKAEKYYEELKKKYSNMDFILVSEDQKANAKANASAYAQSGKMVVLVDENKIEKMAEDENYRAQYEGLIEQAAAGLNQFAESVKATGAAIKGFGVQVNDNGTTSMFAVLEKSTEAQAKRIEEKREANRAQKKAEAKKEAKEKQKQRIEESRDAAKAEKGKNSDSSEDVVLNADSWEELIRKIEDYVQTEKSNNTISDTERLVGQSIDFSV